MTYHVFHSDHGVAMAVHRVFDTYAAVVDYLSGTFLPSCADGLAHIFHGDTMMMTLCVTDGHLAIRRPVSDPMMW